MSAPDGPTVFKERYELHRRLARGGMSDVYLARDIVLDRPVAVKVMFPEYAKDETFVERFRREAQAAARLTHGNIVAIYDWGEELGTYFIAMEYVDGRSLAETIRAEGPLPATRAARIAASVADALSSAHHNGVVHRDVKPGNILISPTGQVKVADFGIAQALTGGEQVNLTQTGAVMGTATYFSPEQAQGKQVDPRSDLYSLGCVIYEMLVGRPPFTGDTPVAIAYHHVQEQPTPPSALGVAVPAPLEAIVMKLLRKDPETRYASAEDLRVDLAHFLDGERVSATDDVLAAGAPTAAMAATAAIPVAGAVPASAPPPTEYDTIPDQRRARSGWLVALTVVLLIVLAAALFQIGSNLSSDQTQLVDVPTVINLTSEDAEEQLRAAGFEIELDEQTNDTVPTGIVFEQDPAGGTRAEEGSTVRIAVSSGVGEEAIPNVVGLEELEAFTRLRDAGFEPRAEEENDDEVPAGRVIRQDPSAGSMQERGSRVLIVVSTGPDSVTVPNVVGQNEATAANTLEGRGLTVAIEREFSNTVSAGQVIRTRPPGGEDVPGGSTVTIVVSRGPDESTTTTTAPPPETTTTTAPPPETTTTTAPPPTEPPTTTTTIVEGGG